MFCGSPRSGDGNSLALLQPSRGSTEGDVCVAVCATVWPKVRINPINTRKIFCIRMLRDWRGRHRYYPQLNDLRQELGGDTAVSLSNWMLADPAIDQWKRMLLDVDRQRDRFHCARGHHPPAGRRLGRCELRKLCGMRLIVEIDHEVRNELVAEIRTLPRGECVEILQDEIPCKLRLPAGLRDLVDQAVD